MPVTALPAAVLLKAEPGPSSRRPHRSRVDAVNGVQAIAAVVVHVLPVMLTRR
jgi:hypothetical protein